MAVERGMDVLIQIDTVSLTAQTDASFEMVADMLDATTKLSTNNAKEYLKGEHGGTFSASGKYDMTATEGVDEALADLKAGTTVVIKWGGIGEGDTYYSANAKVSRVSLSAPRNDIVTFDIDFQITGDQTTATVASS